MTKWAVHKATVLETLGAILIMAVYLPAMEITTQVLKQDRIGLGSNLRFYVWSLAMSGFLLAIVNRDMKRRPERFPRPKRLAISGLIAILPLTISTAVFSSPNLRDAVGIGILGLGVSLPVTGPCAWYLLLRKSPEPVDVGELVDVFFACMLWGLICSLFLLKMTAEHPVRYSIPMLIAS